MQIKEQAKEYDVCIVGSGAGGGMAAHTLANAGIKVALVEAGPFFDPAQPQYQTQMKWPWESPRRGAGSTRAFGDFDAALGGWEIEGEPYTRKNGTQFDWFRSHMLGGRTNHWGRISLRFGSLDFKRKDYDGMGANWPISYEDVAPYYDRIDKMLGVFGSRENIPNEPDGYFLPPPKPRLHELYYTKACKKLKIPVIPARLSILTRKINDKRGVCFYCRQCSRACRVYADFSSSSVLVIPALETNNVDLFTNSVVREVTTNQEGIATGVSYVSKEDMKEYKIKSKVVVLAASACSSARILLNSKSSQHPNGLGNSSDTLGKYLHDSTGASRSGFVPALMNREIYNEDGVGGMHIYTPWWLNDKKLPFSRGYHIEVWGGIGMPSYGFGFGASEMNRFVKDATGYTTGGYGSKLKKDVRRFYGSVVGMSGRGECIARKENYCEIDPDVVDKYGIPVLRFNYKWSDEEIKQANHMQDTFEEILTTMGAEILGNRPGPDRENGLAAPGRIIHEVGTTRMGDNPRTSVTNKYEQLHDAKNVYVVDGGPFVSQADKNPTWTILALSLRTSEYIIDQLKKMNI